jgi:hypothetical protein
MTNERFRKSPFLEGYVDKLSNNHKTLQVNCVLQLTHAMPSNYGEIKAGKSQNSLICPVW